jgi:hypothetical protein
LVRCESEELPGLMSKGRIVVEQTQGTRSRLSYQRTCAPLIQADMTTRGPSGPAGSHRTAVPTRVELDGNAAGPVLDQLELIGN